MVPAASTKVWDWSLGLEPLKGIVNAKWALFPEEVEEVRAH